MYNTLNIDLSAARLTTINPDIDISGNLKFDIEITDEYTTLKLSIREEELQKIYDESCSIYGVDTYAELENKVSDLQNKLMKVTDNLEQIKEAYEELRRR